MQMLRKEISFNEHRTQHIVITVTKYRTWIKDHRKIIKEEIPLFHRYEILLSTCLKWPGIFYVHDYRTQAN